MKQGYKLAPTLYGIYAAVLLLLAYENFGHQFSIKIMFRYDGDPFDLRRLKAKTETFIDFIREAKYGDDIVISSDSALGLQTAHSLQQHGKTDESVNKHQKDRDHVH